MPPPHGVRFVGSQFWVTHRHREYGPFDYQWSRDLGGIELTYRGEKFGEYCSEEELYADLKEYRLPIRVVEVSSILLGCVIYAVLHSLSETEREEMFLDRLRSTGHEKFTHFDHRRET